LWWVETGEWRPEWPPLSPVEPGGTTAQQRDDCDQECNDPAVGRARESRRFPALTAHLQKRRTLVLYLKIASSRVCGVSTQCLRLFTQRVSAGALLAVVRGLPGAPTYIAVECTTLEASWPPSTRAVKRRGMAAWSAQGAREDGEIAGQIDEWPRATSGARALCT